MAIYRKEVNFMQTKIENIPAELNYRKINADYE